VEKSDGVWFECDANTGPVQLGGAFFRNLENLTVPAVQTVEITDGNDGVTKILGDSVERVVFKCREVI
jgi:hypothetical protein